MIAKDAQGSVRLGLIGAALQRATVAGTLIVIVAVESRKVAAPAAAAAGECADTAGGVVGRGHIDAAAVRLARIDRARVGIDARPRFGAAVRTGNAEGGDWAAHQ